MKKTIADSYISPLHAFELYKNGAIVVDVREEFEFADKGISGDRVFNFPISSFDELCMQIPANTEVIIVCVVGLCSEKAAEILISKKFKNVHIVQGGILAWSDEGLPMYTNPQKLPDELSEHRCTCGNK